MTKRQYALRWNNAKNEEKMTHKAFQNKISKLKKNGKAKFCKRLYFLGLLSQDNHQFAYSDNDGSMTMTVYCISDAWR